MSPSRPRDTTTVRTPCATEFDSTSEAVRLHVRLHVSCSFPRRRHVQSDYSHVSASAGRIIKKTQRTFKLGERRSPGQCSASLPQVPIFLSVTSVREFYETLGFGVEGSVWA